MKSMNQAITMKQLEREYRSEDVKNEWTPERVYKQNIDPGSAANSLDMNTALKYPKYATKRARVGSYSELPDIVGHTPEVLADAGFFYAGFGDCVRCFHCGLGLRHWVKGDDPWIEHARWSKDCVFVRQMKGEEYVRIVQMAVQWQSQENEAQSNSSGNQLPVQEVDELLSDAVKSVLEMGYQPGVIRNALEQILRQNGNVKITARILMEKVLDITEAEAAGGTAKQSKDKGEANDLAHDVPADTASIEIEAASQQSAQKQCAKVQLLLLKLKQRRKQKKLNEVG